MFTSPPESRPFVNAQGKHFGKLNRISLHPSFLANSCKNITFIEPSQKISLNFSASLSKCH
jgi:hypothetical protein